MFWKIFSGIIFLLLLLSNSFWVYTSIDHAYSMAYFEDSCEKYLKDRDILLGIIKRFNSKERTMEFLSKRDVVFDTFERSGEGFIVVLNSFELIFDDEGHLIEVHDY